MHPLGAHASRALLCGEAALPSERPLVALQASASRRRVVCCSSCFAPLGSLDGQLSLSRGAADRNSAACCAHSPLLSSSPPPPPAQPCARGCGELYCDAACAACADAEGHLLLCTGLLESAQHPLYRFKQLALQSGRDELLLAAALLSRLLLAAAPVPDSLLTALRAAPPWHEAASLAAQQVAATPGGEAALRAALRGEVSEAWALLGEGLEKVGAPPPSPWLCESSFSAAVTLVSLRATETSRATPLGHFVSVQLRAASLCADAQALAAQRLEAALADARRHEAAERSLRSAHSDAEEEDGDEDDWEEADDPGCASSSDSSGSEASEASWCADADESPAMRRVLAGRRTLCPSSRTLALFPALAQVRHSCVPNCVVTFDGVQEGRLAATLRASCDIAAGEELTRSWLDDELAPPAQRAMELRRLLLPPCECDACALNGPACAQMGGAQLVQLARRAAARGAHAVAESAWRAALRGDDAADAAFAGDAHHGLGVALLNQEDWSGAHAAWRSGLLACPTHHRLAAVAASCAAFAACAAAPSSRALGISMPAGKGRHLVLSRQAVLSPAACAAMIDESEQFALSSGGWSTQRHVSVPTTDVPLLSLPGALELFNSAMRDSIAPLAASLFPRTFPPGARLRVHDAFLVRYDAAKGQASLPAHRDQAQLSLTLALNGDFQGGGTAFEALGQAGVHLQAGHALLFPSGLVHSGATVTEGVRYIVAAFLWVEQ